MIKFYLLCLLAFTNIIYAQTLILPAAKDFFADAQKVQQNKTPILIMFSVADCPYCEKVKEDIIGPMAQIDEHQQRVIIRHIDADSFAEINNFYNEKVSQNKFAAQYAVDFFPTIILVDNYGAILAKMIGVSSEEFYWAELDKLIKKSSNKLTL